MNVLFIASNIPTPVHRNNDIILTIAGKLSKYCNIEIIYPKSYVPAVLKRIKKYRKIYQGSEWQYKGKTIVTYTYPRFPFKGWAFRYIENYFNLRKFDFHNDVVPDLVHAHYVFADGSLAYLINKKYDVPYIVTARGYDVRKIMELDTKSFDYRHAREVLMNAKKVLCLNHLQKNVIESHFPISVEVLPHGIDETEIAGPVFLDKQKVIRITVVGELLEQKRILWVIDAVKNYKGKSKLDLTVIGDGPLLESYKNYSKECDNIRIKGRVPRSEVMSELTRSDIFCLPSENESFGLVYLEAAAKGNAIIARHEDGIWKVFDEGTEMLYAKDVTSFNELLYGVIDNQDLRKSLSINANKKVKELTWKNISRRYYDNYKSIVNNN